jgi:hypothetical protein
MTPADPPVSVAVIRRTAELAVAAASLRVVADEIGISAMGLRAFIRGEGDPRRSTVRKVNAWYARRAAARGTEGLDDARAVLVVLAGLYPRADRSRVLRTFFGLMVREFQESRMPLPPWVAALEAELTRLAE